MEEVPIALSAAEIKPASERLLMILYELHCVSSHSVMPYESLEPLMSDVGLRCYDTDTAIGRLQNLGLIETSRDNSGNFYWLSAKGVLRVEDILEAKAVNTLSPATQRSFIEITKVSWNALSGFVKALGIIASILATILAFYLAFYKGSDFKPLDSSVNQQEPSRPK